MSVQILAQASTNWCTLTYLLVDPPGGLHTFVPSVQIHNQLLPMVLETLFSDLEDRVPRWIRTRALGPTHLRLMPALLLVVM